MSSFADAYLKLLLLQYRDKPKATGDMKVFLNACGDVYDLLQSLPVEFDVDIASGKQLDIIGRIVGLSRIIPYAIPRKYFGFNDNLNCGGYSDIFNDGLTAYPFRDLFRAPFDDYMLTDEEYIIFIKLKIAKNIGSGYLGANTLGKISIQQAVMQAFNGQAFIADNEDMTLTLYISSRYEYLSDQILKMNLLPKGQGVKIKTVIIADNRRTFGFARNRNAKSFGDVFNPMKENAGHMSKLLLV